MSMGWSTGRLQSLVSTLTGRLRDRGTAPLDFHGSVVVLTGGSRGLGLALARAFAGEGARIVLLARDEAELARARVDLASRGADVLALPCDVRQRAALEAVIQRTIDHYGRIDVLVNNAGIIQVGPVEHMSLADFEDAMAVHFWAALYAMRAVMPQMRAQGGGRIVNIASIGGLIALPHLVPYSASKFALVGLSDGMRAEAARDGIHVTTVCPGLMRTGSHLNAYFKGRRQVEFTAFALLGSQPIVSIDVDRAARQIVEACRSGRAHLTITVQARLAAAASALAPGVLAGVMKLAARLLPGPIGPQGDERSTGWESATRLAPSIMTRLADRATSEFNGLRGHRPPG